ncbi:MAG: hypothetical protein QNL62_04475 [Gammaproteobacteria bacterium]|nr:hypothetical protein [Gammaproteobacteria bacterium]
MSQQVIKHREIHFCLLHANPDQAHSAVFIINDLNGILMSHVLGQHRIEVTYDLNQITLEEIEGVMRSEGFHLNNSIIEKIKRSIVFYCEEASRENSKQERLIEEAHEKHTGDVIYLRPKKKKLCDCRDHRPESWRHYL